MIKSKLSHPVFLCSILILIINDFYLKQTFHNSLTGKLSDFAGLFAFPFFWSILFPKQIRAIHCATAILFVFWKSNLSQPLIEFINSFGLNTYRTVDFTDNVALISVLMSYYVCNQSKTFELSPTLLRAICAVSIFAFVATTQKRTAPTYEDRFKPIDIYNQGQHPLTVIVNFKYSMEEISLDSSLNNQFNQIDTVKLGANSSSRIITPIFQGDSVNFPLDFRIVVLDTLNKIIKTYNKTSFFKFIDSADNGQLPGEYADYWKLRIGVKPPEKLKPWTIYGRWETIPSSKTIHSFEIREQYYYDVDPNGDVAQYQIQDSTVIISYPKKQLKAKVLKLDQKNLTIEWDDGKVLKYEKVYK